MSFQENINYFHQIDKEFDEVLHSAFPWMQLSSHGNSGPNFHAKMPTKNDCLKNSEYYYSGKMEFFHITDIRTVFSILNNKSIRLYNLHSSEDAKEFIYGANLLGLSESEIKIAKDNVFTFSFCPITELENQKVWEKHSDNFSKAAIVFEIRNDISKWDKYHISQVYYEEPVHFVKFRQQKRLLQSKYPRLNFYTYLNPLIPFHKEKDWSFEKEVRLVGCFPFQSATNSFEYKKLDIRIEKGRNRLTNYIELPLSKETSRWNERNNVRENLITYQDYDEKIFDTVPEIRIKDVLFGKNCGLDLDDLGIIRNELQDYILRNLKYHINLSYNFFGC
jgi:hypothetical protein